MAGTNTSARRQGPDPRVIEALKKAVATAGDDPANTLLDPVLEEHKANVRRRALLLLDQRSRSRSELNHRLAKLDFDPQLIELVLDDLEHAGLIDDLAFARQWVRQRHERRGKSRQMLDKELRDKGVDPHSRALALEEIDEEDERRKARMLAEKKASTITVVPADRGDYERHLRRILGMLARRGFPQAMSMTLAREALDSRIDELGA